ncbi:methyltransferase [Roseivivax halodurans JCM 10272]|uniref:Methyltransferase n=1 Tax=Roseivivax halodurans JCM 10272 TaxID=1449350 RepID=X7EK99_9RHOB|nr:SAM-dependent methyltransferase [Roseivivax halodurans]ETX16337.1 methyltransferase [Roseivivax halodurans JCM 10272]
MPAPETLRHLAGIYARSDDPWDHASSAYEREKHAETIKAAGPGRLRHAVEIGCGNGVLAERLAPRCERLTVVECIPVAAAMARARLARFGHVTVIEGDASVFPAGAPDLVVLSEMLYFLQPDEIASLAETIDARAAPRCRVVSVNWLGATDETLGGREAADLIAHHLGRWARARHCFPAYLMDVFELPDGACSDRCLSRPRAG